MKKGFTLIEAIMAMAIFSVGIMAVLTVFPKGISLGREAKEITVATQLAQEKIEETLSLSYDDIPVGQVEARSKVDTDTNSQFYIYEREVSSELVDNDLLVTNDDIGLKKIQVKVYWQQPDGEKNVEIIRLLNRP